jgi:hypothetical protein
METGSSPAKKEEMAMLRSGERGALPKKETVGGADVILMICAVLNALSADGRSGLLLAWRLKSIQLRRGRPQWRWCCSSLGSRIIMLCPVHSYILYHHVFGGSDSTCAT